MEEKNQMGLKFEEAEILERQNFLFFVAASLSCPSNNTEKECQLSICPNALYDQIGKMLIDIKKTSKKRSFSEVTSHQTLPALLIERPTKLRTPYNHLQVTEAVSVNHYPNSSTQASLQNIHAGNNLETSLTPTPNSSSLVNPKLKPIPLPIQNTISPINSSAINLPSINLPAIINSNPPSPPTYSSPPSNYPAFPSHSPSAAVRPIPALDKNFEAQAEALMPQIRTKRQKKQFLKSWLRKRMNDPYPSQQEKDFLVRVTQMSLKQVSTWLANARRRLIPRWQEEEKLDQHI